MARTAKGPRAAKSSAKPMANPLSLVSVADVITGLAAFSGIMAIYMFFRYFGDITLGTAFIVISIILDGMAGAAARRWGTKHEYGHVLDSIADSISFCIAPGVLVFVVYFNGDLASYQGGLSVTAACLVTMLGISRLVRYTLEGYKHSNFSGLPSPASAFTLCLVAHILGPENWYIAIPLVLIAAYSMVAPVPYPKLKGKPGIAFVVVLVIATSYIIAYRALTNRVDREVFDTLSTFGLLAVYTYIIGGPVFQTLLDRMERSTEGAARG
jgi:CDP-diacylglycerol--serine O-phosphatidyltransferase